MAPRFGIWKPLPEANKQPFIIPTIAVAHSIVGSARSAYNYFRDGTSIESHWIMTWGGETWQCMEADRQADANYKINRWWDGKVWRGALSMETEDDGNPNTQPWSGSQLSRLIEWFRWCNTTFGIPLEVSAAPFAAGIGYHSLHPYHWTNAVGKTCAGTIRNKQFNEIIVPALQNRTPPPSKTPAEEEDDAMAKWAFLIEKAYQEKFGNNLSGHPKGAAVAHLEISRWVVAIAAKPEDQRHGGINWIRQFELGLAGI